MAANANAQMDAGQVKLEKEYEKLTKELRKEYDKAGKEVEAKLNDYLAKFEKKDDIKRAAVRSGALSKAEYEEWRVGQIAIGERWKEMRDVLAKDLTNADKIARAMINDKMPDAYAIGHNYATFTVEAGSLVDTSYTLYNRNAVQKLVQDKLKANQIGLLPSKLNVPKDMRWNRQHIQSAVMQGVLQGDRIPNIAKRLRSVTGMDYKASIRNARTAMTSAHNLGRMDSLRRAKDMGIEVSKEWVTYVDNVTRDSHIDVNGEIVPIEKTFSNGLDAPGGMGPPEEVYNCRCTMVAAFPKDKGASDRIKEADSGSDEPYDDWERNRIFSDDAVRLSSDVAVYRNNAEKLFDGLEDFEKDFFYGKYSGDIGKGGLKKLEEDYFRESGFSESEYKEMKSLLQRHAGNAAEQSVADKEIVDALRSSERIGDALRAKIELEETVYARWIEENAAKGNAYEWGIHRGEKTVYRKGSRKNGVESWTTSEEGADMGSGGIGYDHVSSVEKLRKEGYHILNGVTTLAGAVGESEVTFVRFAKTKVKVKAKS